MSDKLRKKQTRQRRSEPVTEPAVIDPNGVYSEAALTKLGICSYETRWRERKAGRLKQKKIGARTFYLGSDLLAWLKGGDSDEAK